MGKTFPFFPRFRAFLHLVSFQKMSVFKFFFLCQNVLENRRGVSSPRVRIPLSPPFLFASIIFLCFPLIRLHSKKQFHKQLLPLENFLEQCKLTKYDG